MLRSFKLHCALGTLAVACGGSTDDNLFGDAVKGQSGGRSAGGTGNASGEPSPTPTGGRAAVTGGRASGIGGAAGAQGGETEPGSGGTSSAGLGGMGGVLGDGGFAPEGGTTASGGTSEKGGTTAGGTMASGGSPDAGGGMSSATGGATAGSGGGGSDGGPIGKGGAGGTASCQDAREAVSHALEAAQSCDNGSDEQCLGFVAGECCPVPVNDPSSPETIQFQAALTKMNKLCGATLCPAVLCVEHPSAICQSKGSGSGRCVSKSILSL
jgi:hypothetical protein